MPLVRKSPVAPTAAPRDGAGILAALLSGSDDERWSAARAAADIPGSVRTLGECLLRERDARVREAMFTSLVRIGTTQSVEVMLPLIRSDDAQIRTGALDALGSMHDVVRPYVAQLLRDPEPDVRLLACELVRNLGGEDASRLLCALLADEQAVNVCASAVEVLAEIGGPEALPVLAACAERFRGTPFLEFSIRITVDRIRSQANRQRA